MHSYHPRPYLTVYFNSHGDSRANIPARFGRATSHEKAVSAAARRLIANDFEVAVVFSPTLERLTRLARSGKRITMMGAPK